MLSAQMKANLNLFSIVYIIAAALMCNIFQLPDIIKAYLALPAFLIFPQQVGEFTFGIINKIIGATHFDFDPISRYIIAWLTGLITLFLSLLLLVNQPYWNLNLFIILVLLLIIVTDIYKFRVLNNFAFNEFIESIKIYKKIQSQNLSNIIIIVIFIIIGISSVAFLKIDQPTPLMCSPIYNYTFKILEFVEGDVFFIRLGHMPIIPLLIGLLSKLFNVNYIWLFSTSYVINFILFPIGIYLFSYEVSKDRILSLFAAFLSPWVIGSIVLHNFSTKPLLSVLFPFLLYIIYKNKMIKKLNFNELLLVLSITYIITVPFLLNKVLMNDMLRNVFFIVLPISILFISKIFQRIDLKQSFLILSRIIISGALSIYFPLYSSFLWYILLAKFLPLFGFFIEEMSFIRSFRIF